MNPFTTIRQLVILGYPDLSLDEHLDIACELCCDVLTAQGLISIPDDYDDEDGALTDALTTLARRANEMTLDRAIDLAEDTFCDPTQSLHAAHIRDTLRDNR